MPEDGDQMKRMTRMMVEKAKMDDEMFKLTEVEKDEFEENLLYFVSKDSEVAEAMNNYMMRINKMRQQMGPMGEVMM